MKKIMLLIVVLLLMAAVWWFWLSCGGVSHRELKKTVQDESSQLQTKLDARCDALETKLDRIEAKLDRLIELATPKLPDAMVPAP